MKRFSDLNIELSDDRKIFECQQVSITEVINCEIEIIEYLPEVKTRHGDGRFLVHFKRDGRESKFFTNSRNIKSTLEAVEKTDYPFLTTIKCMKVGSSTIYKFT
jgi:hypothetical protein